jgi:hypothetical protein
MLVGFCVGRISDIGCGSDSTDAIVLAGLCNSGESIDLCWCFGMCVELRLLALVV